MKNILIIGNSHSVDGFQLLNEVFRTQQPEEEYILGISYHSGCSITQHIGFARTGAPEVDFYKNVRGEWSIIRNTTEQVILESEAWDTVFLQAAKSDLDDTLNLAGRRELEAIVCEHLPTPPCFMWHTSWPSPNDEYFFSDQAAKPAPAGYKDRLIEMFGFDPLNQITVLMNKAKDHILGDSTYAKAVCTGAGIINAYLVQGCSQREIWRDYTHLTDFGRMIAAHTMYAQLTGKPLEAVKIDTVPTVLRQKRFQPLGDLTVTEEMKEIILRAANAALADPWTPPVR